MNKIDRKKINTWFVTGASSGVGHELCEQLLRRGYNVIAISRRTPIFRITGGGYSDKLLCISCDVTSLSEIEETINAAIDRFGSIDVLSNNAGVSSNLFIEDESAEHVLKVMNTNFFGTFNTMKALIPRFREQGYGTIINNTSQSGLTPRATGCAYCSSKYAIEGLTGVAWIETQKFCRVLTLELGFFRGTEVTKHKTELDKKYLPSNSKGKLDVYKNLKPPHRRYKYDFYSDLKLGVKYLIDEIEKSEPQRRLILGRDAVIKLTSEIESLKHDLKASRARALNVSKNLKYKRHRILRMVIKCLVDKKRYKKLKRDPGSFFSDSQSTIIKLLGKFYN